MSDRPLKIAVVIPEYGPVGGAENFAYQLSERLALQEDLDIHVVAARRQKCASSVTFHRLPALPVPRFLRPAAFAYLAQRHIEKEGYDLVHGHDRLFRMDILSFHGIPHATWIRKTKRSRLSLFDRVQSWVEGKGIDRGCLLLAVSSLVAEELRRVYPIFEERLSIMGPGVDLHAFAPDGSGKIRADVRRHFGLAADDILLLFVSMNFELKRLDLVIRGLAMAIQTHPEAAAKLRLLVVGKGNQERYRALARQLAVEDRVRFAGMQREIAPFYRAGDILVLPSRFDTFGMVVLEAMAAGLPVIIGRQVGARDLVEDGVNGLILPEPPEPSHLAEAIGQLLAEERHRVLGQRAQVKAEGHDWDVLVAKMGQLYRRLAGR